MSAMYWLALFNDAPDKHAVRAKLAAEHFAYLESNRDRIRLAGGLRAGPHQAWSGGAWVISATTYRDAAVLCEGDPFFVHGLRQNYTIMQWGRAPCYGMAGTLLL